MRMCVYANASECARVCVCVCVANQWSLYVTRFYQEGFVSSRQLIRITSSMTLMYSKCAFMKLASMECY